MTIYIGFSTKTHKTIAQIVCHKYKHCAPIKIMRSKVIIYQFVNYKKIVAITIRKQDLEKLKLFGWTFIQYKPSITDKDILKIRAITCVNFTKRVCRIRNMKIQTPDALFRYLQ